jgi:hypothetical protein
MSDCFWVKRDEKGGICLACHHVDNCAVTSSSDELAFELRDTLKEKYGLTDARDLTWHLGMSINIKPGAHAHIGQTLYTESIIQRFNMCHAKPMSTPMSNDNRISADDSPAEINVSLRQEYMELVGSLMYLAYMSRPDIAYACSQLG